MIFPKIAAIMIVILCNTGMYSCANKSIKISSFSVTCNLPLSDRSRDTQFQAYPKNQSTIILKRHNLGLFEVKPDSDYIYDDRLCYLAKIIPGNLMNSSFYNWYTFNDQEIRTKLSQHQYMEHAQADPAVALTIRNDEIISYYTVTCYSRYTTTSVIDATIQSLATEVLPHPVPITNCIMKRDFESNTYTITSDDISQYSYVLLPTDLGVRLSNSVEAELKTPDTGIYYIVPLKLEFY